jgi:hypothetical protein
MLAAKAIGPIARIASTTWTQSRIADITVYARTPA